MAAWPSEVWLGTFFYFLIVFILVTSVSIGRCAGCVKKKENAQIAIVLFIIGGICTWLLWLCVWMHQWHPLLKPTYPS